MKKTLIVALAIIFVGIVIAIIKFVSGMTPGTSVINQYSYSGNVKDFISHVQIFCERDSNVVFKMTDTTGTIQTGHIYYMNIELRDGANDLLYGLMIKRKDEKEPAETMISLVMGFDKKNKTGGYNKEAKGIQPLVDRFEVHFLTPLENTEHITIVSLK